MTAVLRVHLDSPKNDVLVVIRTSIAKRAQRSAGDLHPGGKGAAIAAPSHEPLRRESSSDTLLSQEPAVESPAHPELPFLQRVSSLPMLQRAPAEESPETPDQLSEDYIVDEELEDILGGTPDGGRPLDVVARKEMEPFFGADFSDVRIHEDGAAAKLTGDLNARAFATGPDLYFNKNEYRPDTPEGKHLLAHELTHVLQQKGDGRQALQRKKKKSGEISYSTYQILVPADYTSLEQMYRLFERTVYGKEVFHEWDCGSFCDMEKNRGQIRRFRVPSAAVAAEMDPDVKKEVEERKEEFLSMPPGIKDEVADEANKRYYDSSGEEPGTKIKADETGKAQQWNQKLAEVLQEKQVLESLPPEIKELMGSENTFKPKDYQQLLRIAEKLKTFSKEDLAVYKLLVIRATDNLDVFEKSVDLFLARKKQLEEAMKDKPPPAKGEPASMEEAIEGSWEGFDASNLGAMSEDERAALAQRQAWEVTKAQLKYMKDHPGETAIDFGKTATLMNTGETFKGISKDLAEAANGDANTFARWAAGTGAGAKLSGWLLAVGAIVYALSWLTGIGELATIAAFMGYMLGATIVLSSAEAELRIRAASQATDEKEFREQVTKAGVAYSNVLISVALLAVALGIRFLAKAAFPETVKNIHESLARFRERIRIKGGLKELLPEFESEMSGLRKKLLESGETAKKEAGARADKIDKMSTDEFVENLEKGTDDFFSDAGIKDGQKVPWAEMAKTPEGFKGIEQYKQTLAQELRNTVPKEIDAAVKEQVDALDRMVDEAKKSTTPDEFSKATGEYEKFNSTEEVTKRGKAKEDQVRKEKTDEAIGKIDEEIRKAEAERKAAEAKRKAEEEAEKARIKAEEDAKVEAIKKLRTDDPAKRKEELSFDLDTGKPRPREGEVAYNVEEDWGYFDRYKAPKGKKGDWIGVSGKGKAQTFDHFGLPDNAKVIEANAKLKADGSPTTQRTKFFESLDEHLTKADHVILDIEAVKKHLPAFYDEIMAYIDAKYGRSKVIEYK